MASCVDTLPTTFEISNPKKMPKRLLIFAYRLTSLIFDQQFINLKCAQCQGRQLFRWANKSIQGIMVIVLWSNLAFLTTAWILLMKIKTSALHFCVLSKKKFKRIFCFCKEDSVQMPNSTPANSSDFKDKGNHFWSILRWCLYCFKYRHKIAP